MAEQTRALEKIEKNLVEQERRVEQRASSFITQQEFWPVKMTVFGAWSFLGLAILGALTALVLRTAP